MDKKQLIKEAVLFHVTKDKKEQIEKYARLAEQSRSAFIRFAINDKIEKMRREINVR